MRSLGCGLLLLLVAAGCGGSGGAPTPAVSEQSPSSDNAAGVQTAASTPRQPLEELLAQAEAALQQRNGNAALEALTLATQQYPQETTAWVKRGSLLADAGLLPAAVQDFNVAIELEPRNPKLLNTRGYFFLLAKNYDAAARDFSAAIALDLQYPQPYNNRGLVHIARQDYVAAIREFDAALDIDREYVDATNNRGFALLQLERYEEALAAFTRALEIDPNYLNALNNRGRVLERMERYEESVADFTRAIELAPQQLQYYTHRAEAYRLWGRHAEARQDLEHVTRMNRLQQLDSELRQQMHRADLWTARGELLLADGQLEAAASAVERALAIDRTQVKALILSARLATARQDWAKVISLCEEALAAGAGPEAYALRGVAYLEQQQLDAAIADFEAGKRMDSRVAAAYKERSERRRSAGDKAGADADLRVAVAFDPTLGNGEILPVAAEAPAPVRRQFPTREELDAVQPAAGTQPAPQPRSAALPELEAQPQ